MTLRALDLVKSFQSVCAVDRVSFEVTASIVAIVGANGAGKTTLFNVLTGVARPDSGRWFLNDVELTGFAPHEIVRRGVARTFQEVRLVSRLSVLENVMLACPGQRGERLAVALFVGHLKSEELRNRTAAANVLAQVGLSDHIHRGARDLSFGEQKMLTLACALATGANVLLLDEPLAGLDEALNERVRRLLVSARETGKLVIFADHDAAAVRAIADTVFVMRNGRIELQGAPNEVMPAR